jgi:phosphomannomutase
MSFKINHSVFREYYIRGIAGVDLSEEFAERLGIAKASTPRERAQLTVPVGHDCRGLNRASNTEPVLSLRFEAISQARLDEIKKVFEVALIACTTASGPSDAIPVSMSAQI